MSEPIPAEPTFEVAMARLEAIIQTMEQGSAPLDEMIRQFESARALSVYCRQKLDTLKQKIDLLVKDSPEGQQWKTVPPPANNDLFHDGD